MTTTPRRGRLIVHAMGRPAPQGSKRIGAGGAMREQSNYLPAWRAAVRRAIYEQYKVLGVEPADLPYLRGPVGCAMVFYLPPGRPIDGPPDLDKLIRSTWDALTVARAWEDDGRVTFVDARKRQAGVGDWTGAHIEIWGEAEEWRQPDE